MQTSQASSRSSTFAVMNTVFKAEGVRLSEGARRIYRSVFDALARMGRDEGLKSYVRGLWPNCFRAAGMTSCQLASYDGSKTLLISRVGFDDTPTCQLTASILASFVATTVCSPLDVIKTKTMSASRSITAMHVAKELTKRECHRWIFRG